MSCTTDNSSCKGESERNENAVCSPGEAEPTNYTNIRASEHKLASNLSLFYLKKKSQVLLQEGGAWNKGGKLWERELLWSDCTVSFSACYGISAIWFSFQKTKVTSIITQQHYPATIHNEQWPITCAQITSTSQWAGQCIPYRNRSSLIVAQRFFSPSDLNSKTFHMQILLSKQLLDWLISLTLAYENSGISAQLCNYLKQKKLFNSIAGSLSAR